MSKGIFETLTSVLGSVFGSTGSTIGKGIEFLAPIAGAALSGKGGGTSGGSTAASRQLDLKSTVIADAIKDRRETTLGFIPSSALSTDTQSGRGTEAATSALKTVLNFENDSDTRQALERLQSDILRQRPPQVRIG